jgi:hypothetical protein
MCSHAEYRLGKHEHPQVNPSGVSRNTVFTAVTSRPERTRADTLSVAPPLLSGISA